MHSDIFLFHSVSFHYFLKGCHHAPNCFYDPLIGCDFQFENHWSIIFFLEHWELNGFVGWPGTVTIIYNIASLQKHILISKQLDENPIWGTQFIGKLGTAKV